MHADENSVTADDRIPTLADRGLDADLDLGITDDPFAIGVILLEKQGHARHGTTRDTTPASCNSFCAARAMETSEPRGEQRGLHGGLAAGRRCR